MASNPTLDLTLTSLSGESRELNQWLTTFHLASVVLDPFTNESSWILPTATRILASFRDSAARANLVLTCGPDDARSFLGPVADEWLVFCDPDRSFVRGLALDSLPAFVFVRGDGTLQASAEGWDPQQWRAVAETIAKATAWSRPTIPVLGDPSPFHGTPALG